MPRKSVWLFLAVNIVFIVFLVHSVWTLLSLLVVDGSNDMISRAELPGPNSEVPKSKEMLIPKIIHQTYVNESIPFHWREAQQSCLDLHEDYEYKVGGKASWQRGAVANVCNSSGLTSSRASLLLPSMLQWHFPQELQLTTPADIHGSSKHSTITNSPFKEPTLYDISSLPILVVYI